MQTYEVGRGFESQSVGMGSTSSQTYEELWQAVERSNARVVDAIVDSLSILQRAAINTVFLRSSWPYRDDLAETYVAAVQRFWVLAEQRGLS